MPIPRCALLFVLVPVDAFAAGPRVAPPRAAPLPVRAAAPRASSKILPVANVGLGGALLSAAATGGHSAAVLASTGLLAVFNLAVTDSARYAGAKRSVKIYEGKTSLPVAAVAQRGLARRWYALVRLHTFGQLAGLLWAARATSAAGVLRGLALFMAANVGFFLLGAGPAKHDEDGRPAPMKPKLVTFVLATDAVLLAAALGASLSPAGSLGRALGSALLVVGCLIGAAEGVPKTVGALKALMGR